MIDDLLIIWFKLMEVGATSQMEAMVTGQWGSENKERERERFNKYSNRFREISLLFTKGVGQVLFDDEMR